MSNLTEVKNISLKNLGGPTYIGRPNGEAARKKLQLDSLEKNSSLTFSVDIPEETYNINSSFFLGLFGDSIRNAGSADNFYKRFRFQTHGKEYRAIKRGVERALITNKALHLG